MGRQRSLSFHYSKVAAYSHKTQLYLLQVQVQVSFDLESLSDTFIMKASRNSNQNQNRKKTSVKNREDQCSNNKIELGKREESDGRETSHDCCAIGGLSIFHI